MRTQTKKSNPRTKELWFCLFDGIGRLKNRLGRFGANVDLRTRTMTPIIRSSSVLAFLVLQICLMLFASTLPYSSGFEDSYSITGRFKIPPSNVIGHAAKFSNVKVIVNGGQKITFLRLQKNKHVSL